MTDECAHCGGEFHLTESVAVRRSTGFGAANEEVVRFCGRECRARWQDNDVVLATTRQATLARFRDYSVDAADPATIAWNCAVSFEDNP